VGGAAEPQTVPTLPGALERLQPRHCPRSGGHNYIEPFEIWNTSYLRYIDEMYGGSIAAANPAVNVAI